MLTNSGDANEYLAQMTARLHHGQRRWLAQLTPPQLAEFMAPLQEGARWWWASLTPEKRSKWPPAVLELVPSTRSGKADAGFSRQSRIANGLSRSSM